MKSPKKRVSYDGLKDEPRANLPLDEDGQEDVARLCENLVRDDDDHRHVNCRQAA